MSRYDPGTKAASSASQADQEAVTRYMETPMRGGRRATGTAPLSHRPQPARIRCALRTCPRRATRKGPTLDDSHPVRRRIGWDDWRARLR